MNPPNTVPITAEELQAIKKLPDANFVVYFCYPDGNYSLQLTWNPKVYKRTDDCKYRIAAHDYRQYLGEVVDLKEYNIGGDTVSYCGNTFQLVEHSGSFHLWNISNGGVKSVISYTKSECKQWLCDHFTVLFKKDLPHLNIKFIWS